MTLSQRARHQTENAHHASVIVCAVTLSLRCRSSLQRWLHCRRPSKTRCDPSHLALPSALGSQSAPSHATLPMISFPSPPQAELVFVSAPHRCVPPILKTQRNNPRRIRSPSTSREGGVGPLYGWWDAQPPMAALEQAGQVRESLLSPSTQHQGCCWHSCAACSHVSVLP